MFYVWWSSTQPKAKMIWYLDSAHQNSWKTLSFSISYALTHQKLITNQLYSSDKMMVHITKTHIILCLMIFHSTKSKNDMIFGFSIKTVGNHSLSVIHMLPHTRNQFPSNFTAVTKSWFRYQKHLLFMVWWSSHQPNMIW